MKHWGRPRDWLQPYNVREIGESTMRPSVTAKDDDEGRPAIPECNKATALARANFLKECFGEGAETNTRGRVRSPESLAAAPIERLQNNCPCGGAQAAGTRENSRVPANLGATL